MKLYPHNIYLPSPDENQLEIVLRQTLREPTDEEFISYIQTFIQTYREIIDEEFPEYKTILPFYQMYPFQIKIWRLGRSPVWGYKANQEKFDVEIIDSSVYNHFDNSIIIFQQHLSLDFVYLDFESLHLLRKMQKKEQGNKHI